MPRTLSLPPRLALLCLALLLLAACGRNRDEPTPVADAPAPASTPVATAAPSAPAPSVPATTAAEAPAQPQTTPTPIDPEKTVITPSGLQYTETQPGTGPQPQPGQVVAVHYTGTLEDGTVFDSSYNQGKPFCFALGARGVIPGWEEGIALMHQGGQAILVIPPDLAYGEEGYPGVIPPNATLIFDLELVEIRDGAPDTPTPVDESALLTTTQGLKYVDLVEGTGPSPMPGQLAVVNYTGWLADGGKFTSSLDSCAPAEFNLGMGQVIAGWDLGIATMKVGGKRQLHIPAELAYGSQGRPPLIPPNAPLIFEVELLELH